MLIYETVFTFKKKFVHSSTVCRKATHTHQSTNVPQLSSRLYLNEQTSVIKSQIKYTVLHIFSHKTKQNVPHCDQSIEWCFNYDRMMIKWCYANVHIIQYVPCRTMVQMMWEWCLNGALLFDKMFISIYDPSACVPKVWTLYTKALSYTTCSTKESCLDFWHSILHEDILLPWCEICSHNVGISDSSFHHAVL